MEIISCNGEHFLSEEFMTCMDLKGASLRPLTPVLTKVPVFPTEKQMLFLPKPTIWAKYKSQGIYKVNKIHSSLLAEKRYSNNRLFRRLPYPGLLHGRVKSSSQLILDLLQWLGFTINWEKFVLVPTQSLTFLGLSIDHRQCRSVSPRKRS